MRTLADSIPGFINHFTITRQEITAFIQSQLLSLDAAIRSRPFASWS